MLVKIREEALLFNKEVLPKDAIELLYDWCSVGTLTYSESHQYLNVSGTPAQLFQLLYDLSYLYDLNIM